MLNDDRNLRERHGASVNTVIALIRRAASFELALYKSLFRCPQPLGADLDARPDGELQRLPALGHRDRSRALQVDREEQGNVLKVVIASRTNVNITLRRGLVSLVREQLARNEGKVDR